MRLKKTHIDLENKTDAESVCEIQIIKENHEDLKNKIKCYLTYNYFFNNLRVVE